MTAGVAHAERLEPLRAPRPASSAERVARRRPRRRARSGTRSSGVSTSAACAANASRNASTGRARDRQAGGGAVAAVALAGGRRAACRPPSRSNAGIERPEPVPSLAVERDQDRRAVVALGDPRGDDADHARVPALAGQHVGRARRRARATCASASNRIRVSTSRRSALTRVELGGDRARRASSSLGQQQLEPRVGAVQAPGGVDARREAEADRGARRRRSGPRARRPSARAGPACAWRASARRPCAHERGGSRRAAARRRRPWRARRGRGPRRPAPGPRPAASSSACASL